MPEAMGIVPFRLEKTVADECYDSLLAATARAGYNGGDRMKERWLSAMLNENIRLARKARGLSQEGLAARINVVRQTVSKWEKGLSVPDADMLISLSEALETPVSALLGETMAEPEERDGIREIAEKLEAINLQLAQRKTARRKLIHWSFIALGAATLMAFALLIRCKSPYLGWDFGEPETAVMATGFHALEWLFVRVGPAMLAGAVVGAFLTRKKA